MKESAGAMLIIVCALLAAAPPVNAQAPPKTIYLPDAKSSGSLSAEQQKIAANVTSFLELRLKSLKELRVVGGEAPCNPPGEPQPTASPQDPAPAQVTAPDTSPAIYEVKTFIKPLSTPTSNNQSDELLLEYDLLRYVRCKATSITHRTQPISSKTAFEGLLEMGDVIEVTLNKEITPPAAVIDFRGITGTGELFKDVQEPLTVALFAKLARETEMAVRDVRGKPPDPSGNDYILSGEFLGPQRGVRFTLQRPHEGKSESFLVRGAGLLRPDEKAIAQYSERAANEVASYIRGLRDYSGPVTDAEAASIAARAPALLCKDQPSGCVSQPTVAIQILTRLKDANRASPAMLELLGDAYTEVEEDRKAAELYDLIALSPTLPADVRLLNKAGDAWYKTQNYTMSADRYEQAIFVSTNQQLPLTDDQFVKATRSRTFANEGIAALKTAIEGLRRFPESQALDLELRRIVSGLSGDQLLHGYQLLSAAKTIPKVASQLSDLKARLADRLLNEVPQALFQERDFAKAEKKIGLVESLGLDSLPQETRALYTLARAVWVRDAKNDFAAAVSALETLAAGESNIAATSKYWLAETLYKRARQAGPAADQKDYARVVELLKQTTAWGDYDHIYSLLLAANNMRGANEDSRQFLEARLQQNIQDQDAHHALAVLCLEYTDDLPCAEEHLGALRHRSADREVIELSLRLRKGQYAEADKLAAETNLSESEPPALFYRTWTLIALDRQAEAEMAARLWQSKMEKLRGFRPAPWVFRAATKALESDRQISERQKELLKQMIGSMNDPALAIPKVADFFAAARPTRR